MAIENQLPVDLQDFASSHHSYQGTVVVLASGPSAKNFPIEACPYPIVAVNGSILMFEGLAARPFYYLCDDPNFVKQRPDLLALGIEKAENVALSRSCFEEAQQRGIVFSPETNFYLLERAIHLAGSRALSARKFAWSIRKDKNLHSGFSFWRRKPNTIGFSRNLSKGYFSARTIAYVAVQLACHLGFSRVCIAGVDLNPESGRGYQEQTPLSSTLVKDFPEHILPSFIFMKRHIIKSGEFEVYNLSDASRLPERVIPRMTVSELIRPNADGSGV